MKIELPDKKRRNVIIISILAFLFLVGGGFLLWRVNQEDSVSPVWLEAGGSNEGCSPGYTCTGACTGCRKNCYNNGVFCGTQVCGGGGLCQCKSGWKLFCPLSGSCADACGDTEETPVTQCTCVGGWGNSCGINCRFPSGTQAEVNAAAQRDCRAKVAMCNGSTGRVDIQNYTSSHPCYGKLSECKNPYAPNPCTTPTPTNKCDGGNWVSSPSGTYAYCDEVKYSFLAKDSDGVNKGSIAVKLNGDARVNASKTTVKTGDTEVKVEETLGSQTNCLTPGEYTLNASWADKKGATSSACTLSTTFTVLEEVKNPDWEIKKVVAESCIDENTDNPKSRLQYTVTITNKGEGAGQITSVEDILDSKVLEGYVESISSNGEFHNGFIIWTLTGADSDFAPSQSKTYTYSYIVPSDAFGFYENTVSAFPSEGATLIANASISADCIILEEIPEDEEIDEEDLPETGIFDDGQSAIIVGFGLLFLGFTWNFIGRGVLVSFKSISLTKERVVKSSRMKKGVDRKRKFEKKIIRD